jgi:hypothetical protein
MSNPGENGTASEDEDDADRAWDVKAERRTNVRSGIFLLARNMMWAFNELCAKSGGPWSLELESAQGSYMRNGPCVGQLVSSEITEALVRCCVGYELNSSELHSCQHALIS